MFVQVSHDASSCKLVTTFVRASKPQHLLLSVFVHVSHYVCSCTLATKWVRAFGCSAVSIVAGFTWEVDQFIRRWEGGNQVLGIFFGSYASYYFELYKSDSSKLQGGTRFLQAVRDIILQEVREWFFDTTRGARVILRSYERCKSDSLKLREIREWFLEATKEEEKATRWLEKVDNSRAWNAVRP